MLLPLVENEVDIAHAQSPNLAGLEVCLSRGCKCGHGFLVTGPGKGPHQASLHCARCRRHCGWLSTEAAAFLTEIVTRFGRPTAPITVRTRRPR
jgi:hypothetical protein